MSRLSRRLAAKQFMDEANLNIDLYEKISWRRKFKGLAYGLSIAFISIMMVIGMIFTVDFLIAANGDGQHSLFNALANIDCHSK